MNGRVFIRSWCWDLISVTGTSGKYPKIFVSRQENQSRLWIPKKIHEKMVFRYPVLRSKPQRWIPELPFGYPPLRNFPNSFWEKLGMFLDSSGGSQRQLCIKTRPWNESHGSSFPKSKFDSPRPMWGRINWCWWETDFYLHHQCWEVLPFLPIQPQWCIKILCLNDPEFYPPLALNCRKGQHLPALEV